MSDLSNWRGCRAPELKMVRGRYVSVEPALFPACAEDLFSVLGGAANDDLWAYLPIGPFENAAQLAETMAFVCEQQNWVTHLFRDAATAAPVGQPQSQLLGQPLGQPLGMASYMRIRPEAGSAEVGCVVFSKKLQRTPAATETMYLMAKHLFDDLGYRRYEWKCHNANEASKRAAIRLGFTFEGVFRQDQVVKGENRDTAWYSIIDTEWPRVKAGFEAWLAPENFDGAGAQRRSLLEIRDAL